MVVFGVENLLRFIIIYWLIILAVHRAFVAVVIQDVLKMKRLICVIMLFIIGETKELMRVKVVLITL